MLDLPIGRTRPGDERGFVHKRILGGISKVAGILPIPGAQVISRVAGAFAGGRRTPSRTQTARVTPFSQAEKNLGRRVKFGETRGFAIPEPVIPGGLPCILPFRTDPRDGRCKLFVGEQGGIDDTPVGEAILGQYGAGLVPGNRVIDRAVCLKGMQLGDDGVCYNKAQITNKQRMWPAGRRPLLSGGDMRALGIAARAGRRLDGATKRLQRLGLMRKPASRRRSTQHQRLLETHVASH